MSWFSRSRAGHLQHVEQPASRTEKKKSTILERASTEEGTSMMLVKERSQLQGIRSLLPGYPNRSSNHECPREGRFGLRVEHSACFETIAPQKKRVMTRAVLTKDGKLAVLTKGDNNTAGATDCHVDAHPTPDIRQSGIIWNRSVREFLQVGDRGLYATRRFGSVLGPGPKRPRRVSLVESEDGTTPFRMSSSLVPSQESRRRTCPCCASHVRTQADVHQQERDDGTRRCLSSRKIRMPLRLDR